MNDEFYKKDTSGCGCTVVVFVLLIIAVALFAMCLSKGIKP